MNNNNNNTDTRINKTVTCEDCLQDVTLAVRQADWDIYINTPRQQRRPIQHLFPYLTTDEREVLVSGVCGPCFDSMMEDELITYPEY